MARNLPYENVARSQCRAGKCRLFDNRKRPQSSAIAVMADKRLIAIGEDLAVNHAVTEDRCCIVRTRDRFPWLGWKYCRAPVARSGVLTLPVDTKSTCLIWRLARLHQGFLN
jgi:hypothetical protein